MPISLSKEMCVRVNEEAANDTRVVPIREIQKYLLYDNVGTRSSSGYISKGNTIRRTAIARFAISMLIPLATSPSDSDVP